MNDAPCADVVTDLFLDFPAPFRAAVECWDLVVNADVWNIDTTVFEPFCDRDVTHLETRGDCIYQCKAGWQECDGDPLNGCESDISEDATCSTQCLECLTLSGIDRTVLPNCIADAANPGDYKCNFTCPGTVDTTVNCADGDGRWETGCEVATNQDRDVEGLFMNEGVAMDCAIMEAEAVKNPELFRHHLHIDLTKEVPTSISPLKFLAPGSIFCDNNMASTALSGGLFGKCFFMCIDGFANTDRDSYNGCEDIDTLLTYPFDFGGYWIGDPHIEEYLDFICTASSDPLYTTFITFASNACDQNDRYSTLWDDVPYWY
jgi:hypothetical protein